MDFKGESLLLRILRKPFVLAITRRLTEETVKRFRGVILTEGNIALKLLKVGEWSV